MCLIARDSPYVPHHTPPHPTPRLNYHRKPTPTYQGDVHGAQKENNKAGQVPRLAVAKESEAFSEDAHPKNRDLDFAPR